MLKFLFKIFSVQLLSIMLCLLESAAFDEVPNFPYNMKRALHSYINDEDKNYNAVFDIGYGTISSKQDIEGFTNFIDETVYDKGYLVSSLPPARGKGHATVVFKLQKNYDHAGLVFEYIDSRGSCVASFVHLALLDDSSFDLSSGKPTADYKVHYKDSEYIVSRLVWDKSNTPGKRRDILQYYPYKTFEVPLDAMLRVIERVKIDDRERTYRYNVLGLFAHNCLTYVAELLEQLGVALAYRSSYTLYFHTDDLKKLLDRMAGKKHADKVDVKEEEGFVLTNTDVANNLLRELSRYDYS